MRYVSMHNKPEWHSVVHISVLSTLHACTTVKLPEHSAHWLPGSLQSYSCHDSVYIKLTNPLVHVLVAARVLDRGLTLTIVSKCPVPLRSVTFSQLSFMQPICALELELAKASCRHSPMQAPGLKE